MFHLVLLFAQVAESSGGDVALKWAGVAAQFGVPTAALYGLFRHYQTVVKDHAAKLADKDAELKQTHKECTAEITRVQREKDVEIQRLSVELSRVNEQRVKESQETTGRMHGEFVDVMTDTNKTLTVLIERLRG